MDTTEINTSSRLFEIIEENSFFQPIKKVNGIAGQFLELETSSDDEDGTYPLIMHYVTLVNKMDKEGTSAYLNHIGGKDKLNISWNGCKIIRASKWDDKATIVFDTPITMIFGYVGEEPITREVKQIEGEFTHEWFWMKKGRQSKVANGFSIFFDCQKFS